MAEDREMQALGQAILDMLVPLVMEKGDDLNIERGVIDRELLLGGEVNILYHDDGVIETMTLHEPGDRERNGEILYIRRSCTGSWLVIINNEPGYRARPPLPEFVVKAWETDEVYRSYTVRATTPHAARMRVTLSEVEFDAEILHYACMSRDIASIERKE